MHDRPGSGATDAAVFAHARAEGRAIVTENIRDYRPHARATHDAGEAHSGLIRTPVANAYAEPFVRTIRTGCLDWLLISSERHLQRILREYLKHYNYERPHRGGGSKHPNRRRVRKPGRSSATTDSED